MDTAFFIVTNRCSRSCPFCFYATRYLSHPVTEMDEGALLGSLDRLAALGVKQLIVTGGEPLLRGETMSLVRKAGDIQMERLILTNGDFLDDRTVPDILECGVEGLSISINATAEAKRIEGAVARLRQSPCLRVTAAIVFNRNNTGELMALYDWARRMRLGTIFQPAYIPANSEQFKRLSPHHLSEDQWGVVERLLREWGAAKGTGGYVDYILGLYGRGGNAKPRRCAMGSQAIVIDCDGAVYPCFHRRDLKAGDLLNTPGEEIMESLERSSREVCAAPCYGEHCVSLFSGQV
jgi:MoaA/NifB/PqqE/SkfB family radical SAM enzyme